MAEKLRTKRDIARGFTSKDELRAMRSLRAEHGDFWASDMPRAEYNSLIRERALELRAVRK